MLTATHMAIEVPLPAPFLSGSFPRRQFAKGAFIKQPDDRSGNIYLIEAGKVVPFFLGPQGQDVPFKELEAGDFVGDLSAFGSEEPATYFQAIEDTVVLVLNRGQFLEALRTVPEFAELVTKTLYSRLRIMKQLYIESRLLPMKARLYAELIRHAVRDARGRLRIVPAPTHAELARRIASQRETVTKQMSHLVKMGVIDNSAGYIEVADEAYLRSEIGKELGFLDFK
ncbi:Crp/Fnr family transcriptional regulator [Bosea minatitlanensis]|uniref:Crp/Fnr family transcriptional regulator n=1 Tax=Bosea minatitlanensis TaxID=128782 RepID=A0ABW0F7Q0_9HYPH|nr:Crp/Fnr family transcriptional regulator [Bosea minatitlanensis]MCT4493024.1 Crp/Fnr family transcriptional regulator [Bosea minatitlanensis]